MCMRNCSKIKVATKDIVVYKIIKSMNRSSNQSYTYVPHKLHRLHDKLRKTEGCVFEGFHSYQYLPAARTRSAFNLKVVEFIIPRGAKYVRGEINHTGDMGFVSTSLRAGSLKHLK